MTKFIKLTECNRNTILINIARIENICLGAKGTDTYVKLLKNSENKENYFFVRETVEEIWNMLTIDNTKSSVEEYYKFRDGGLFI